MTTHNTHYNPKLVYYQAQLRLLQKVEGKHYAEPSWPDATISLGLSAIEAATAFYLLLPAGMLIAGIGACFPVLLLWAMANFIAERSTVVKHYEQLMQKYDYETDL